MVEKEDNFNEFLKQKVQESHFEYHEAYWLKAEQLIESAQPKRKPFWRGFGLGVLSLALVGLVTALVMSNSNAQHQHTKALASVAPEQTVSITGEESPIKNADSNSKLSNKETSADASFDDLLVKKKSNAGQSKKSVYLASVEKSVSKKAVQGKKSVLEKDNPAYESMANFSQVRNLSFELVPDVTAFEEEQENSGSVIKIAPPVIINARPPKAKKDIDVNVVAACDNKKTNEWMFNILAGVSDSRGFEGNTASNNKIGFGYFGGLRLAYKIDKNWFVGIQPLVYSRGAINTSIQTEKTDFDFGVTADEFVVNNKSLLFVELPVSIGYRVGRHQMSVGAGIEYLLNVKSDVKEFGTSVYKPNQWGYTDGFNRLGGIGVFNYAFNVYNEFWLTMMVQKGFTDLTKADYFTTNSTDKNLNLRIGVQYQFNNQKKTGK